jgi:hypothetical protein
MPDVEKTVIATTCRTAGPTAREGDGTRKLSGPFRIRAAIERQTRGVQVSRSPIETAGSIFG